MSVDASEAVATSSTGAKGNWRINEAFARSRAEGRTAIIPFVTAGYPSLERSEALAVALVRGGADLIEIGVPFSDPLADGTTVQRTSEVALENGVSLGDALEMTRRLRDVHGVTIPILLMGYVNPMLRYGIDRLAADSEAVGVDGYIVPDLPAEESDEVLEPFRRHGVDLVFFLAPTSTPERIASVAERATGFIYCVSTTGVTGARAALPDFHSYIGKIRERTNTPIAIGFGVSTPAHVRRIGEVADAAIIASAMINYLDTVPESEEVSAAEQYMRGLRGEGAFPGMSSSSARSTCHPDEGGISSDGRDHAQERRDSSQARNDTAGSAEAGSASAGAVQQQIACRGVRGATTIAANTSEDILEATTDLLEALILLNEIAPEDVVSAVFTTTPELNAAFPALAARNLGWTEVPLLCAHEMAVPGSLQKVIRILLHINSPRSAAEIRHIYLRDARALRPEWAYDDGQLSEILGRKTGSAPA